MKKLSCVILALAMLLSLVACGGTSPSAPAGSTPAPADDKSPAAEIDVEEEVALEFWYQNAKYEPWITKMAEDFHAENANITVTPVIHGDDQALVTALTAAFQEQKAPVLFHTRANNNLATFATEGVLEDLSGYGFDQNMTDAGVAGGTVEGGLYAACMGYSGFCVIYNQDIFDELELTAPTSFDEFVSVVDACKAAGYGGIAYPGSTAGHVWLSRSLFRDAMTVEGYNALELGMDDGSITSLDDYPASVEALKSMAAYYSDGLLYNGSNAMDTETEISLFANGTCAMIVNYTGTMLSTEALQDLNMGIFPLMGQTGDGKYYAEINNMISMYSGASDVEKAAGAKFIEFLLREENMSYYAAEQGEIPSIEGIVADHKYGEMFEQEFAERGVNMRTVCVTVNTEMWKAEFDALQTGLIFDGLDADAEIAKYNQHLQDADIASYA